MSKASAIGKVYGTNWPSKFPNLIPANDTGPLKPTMWDATKWKPVLTRGGMRVAPEAFGKLAFRLIPYVGPALYAVELYGLYTQWATMQGAHPRYWDTTICAGGGHTKFHPNAATMVCVAGNDLAYPTATYNALGGSPATTSVNNYRLTRFVQTVGLNAVVKQVSDHTKKATAPTPRPVGVPLVVDPGIFPDPFPKAAPWPGMPQVLPGPGILPNVFPDAFPPNQPGVFPVPKPKNFPRPKISPRPRPSTKPFSPSPGVWVVPKPGPHSGPTLVISAGPKTKYRPARKPYKGWPPGHPLAGGGIAHKNKPGGKGEKGKYGGKGAGKVAAKIFGAATEGVDMIDAAWHALPGNGGFQTKVTGQKTTPLTKLGDIADAFGHNNGKPFDKVGFIGDFAKNAATAQAIDVAIGKGLGTKAANKAAFKGSGISPGPGGYGWGFGPAL